MDQGGIYEEGPPEQVFDHPKKELTRRFVRHLKVFEVRIDSPSFDLHGAIGELERYGYKNQLPAKMTYRLQAVFEELCQQILLPRYDEPQIHFSVEYDEVENCATVTVRYGGACFDPRETDNTIAISIVEKLSERMEYKVEENAELPNRVEFCIR